MLLSINLNIMVVSYYDYINESVLLELASDAFGKMPILYGRTFTYFCEESKLFPSTLTSLGREKTFGKSKTDQTLTKTVGFWAGI